MPMRLCLALSLIAAAARSVPSTRVFNHGEGGYKCIRIPALNTLKDGSLIAVAEARYFTTDCCFPNGQFNQSNLDTDLVYKRSTDNGASWGEIGLIASNMGEHNVAVLESGEVLVLTSGNDNGTRYIRPNYQVRSLDHGLTWSKPEVVNQMYDSKGRPVTLFNGPGNMIQLTKHHPHAGRIISTGYTYDPDAVGFSGEQCPYWSDDGPDVWPRTYQQGECVTKLDETQIVELNDGDVMMLSRNFRNCSTRWYHNGSGICAALTRSSDGGATWGETVLSRELTGSNNQMPILRTRAGRLYMAHPELHLGGNFPETQRDKGITGQDWLSALRVNGTVRRSPDDGVTWPQTPEMSYSITDFTPYKNVEVRGRRPRQTLTFAARARPSLASRLTCVWPFPHTE